MTSVDHRILSRIASLKGKRSKLFAQHIIEHGSVSTEDMLVKYGYKHAPRAACDVRDQGIPLETKIVKSSSGERIASYSFGNPDDIQKHKFGGRKTLPKKFKQALIKISGSKCAITLESYEAKYLQIDHRIPYEIAGNTSETELSPEHFMLLSSSAQRQKSWDCEKCENRSLRDFNLCKTCYWAYPEKYNHVALRKENRLDLIFQGEEVQQLEKIKQLAAREEVTVKELIIKVFSS